MPKSVESPTGRVEVAEVQAPDGGPEVAHHLQHPYRPFAAAEAAADRHRVASTAARLLRGYNEATTRATATRLLQGYYEAALSYLILLLSWRGVKVVSATSYRPWRRATLIVPRPRWKPNDLPVTQAPIGSMLHWHAQAARSTASTPRARQCCSSLTQRCSSATE